MPKPMKGPRLGSNPSHQKAMMANLAGALIQHESITTTEAKAKQLKPLAERLITFARRGDLHSRRQAFSTLQSKNIVHTLFSDIGPRYSARHGGYTRITKIGPRKGDNAPMAVIELVEPMRVEDQTATAGQAAGQASTQQRSEQGSEQRSEEGSEQSTGQQQES